MVRFDTTASTVADSANPRISAHRICQNIPNENPSASSTAEPIEANSAVIPSWSIPPGGIPPPSGLPRATLTSAAHGPSAADRPLRADHGGELPPPGHG